MSRLDDRRGFLRRLSKNLENIDKPTLLTHLIGESESYEGLLGLLDRLDEGVLIVSPDGEIEFINSAAKKLTGLEPPFVGPFWDGLADADLKDFFESHAHNQSESVQTVRVLNPEERNLRVHWHPKILKKPVRHLISIVDLTHPLLPEVERLARNRLESLIRLAGGLAHEIGNPLNAISLHSEILKKQLQKIKEPSSEKMLGTVQIIQDEIGRLDRIVRNFLKTTRRAPLRFQMLDLIAILKDVLRVMKPSFEEHAIQTEVLAPERLEFYLDEERMRSLFMNLIQNAIESMPDGGKLKVAVKLQGRAVQIVVQDTGKGIAEEDLAHIFEAYFTTKDHGSGLGLMFVYDAVSDHGGKIKAESVLRRGTRFEILLPLRRSNLQINHQAMPGTGR